MLKFDVSSGLLGQYGVFKNYIRKQALILEDQERRYNHRLTIQRYNEQKLEKLR